MRREVEITKAQEETYLSAFEELEAWEDALLYDCETPVLQETRECQDCEALLDGLLWETARKKAEALEVGEMTLALGIYAVAAALMRGSDQLEVCLAEQTNPDTEAVILPLVLSLKPEEKIQEILGRLEAELRVARACGEAALPGVSERVGIVLSAFFVNQIPDFSRDTQTLVMDWFQTEEGVGYRCTYREDVYHTGTIRRLFMMMKNVLGAMAEDLPLREVPLLDAEEKTLLDRFLIPCAQTEETVVDLLCAQFRKTPEQVAVVSGQTQLTYRELDRQSAALAACLAGKGIGKGDVVAVLSDRNERMAVCPLAVSRAGAMYQPLDSTYPVDRLTFMVKDSGAKLLIAPRSLRHLVETDLETVYAEDLPSLPAGDVLPKGPSPEDPFVILYTSGTTGTPKGCILTHHNLTTFIRYYQNKFNLGETSHVAAYASFGFDANMMDTYPTLASGSTLYIIPVEMRLNFEALNRYFEENAITHSFMTTQVGRQFATEVRNHSLQYLIVGGETLTPFVPDQDYKIYNAYGPTETTIVVTFFEVDRYYSNIPIGKANEGTYLYVVDPGFRRVPVGVPGELCIAGPQVSLGYLNRPEKTGEVFVENPFTEDPMYRRMYRTGDVVRFLEDGTIQFIGRRDSQIKVRGFRIELTEVEEVIRRFEGVTDATVVAKDSPTGEKMLWAYVVGEEKIDISALNRFILEEKPPYMVPAATMQIDEIPLNQNMKVDRRRLPEIVMEEETDEETRELTYLEEEIRTVASQVTGFEHIGLSTPLTLAGLNSISALKLAMILEKKFGVEMDVKKLLDNSTILDLENEISRLLVTASLAKEDKGQQPREERSRYPLTQTQLGIYLDSLKAGIEADLYELPILWEFEEGLDVSRLAGAVNLVLRSHRILSAAVRQMEDGNLYMIPDSVAYEELPVVEVPRDRLQEELKKRRTALSLDRLPLYQAILFSTEKGACLYLNLHHIIADGTSLLVLMEDIDLAYRENRFRERTFTQFDLALKEESLRKSEELGRARQYYKDLLGGVEATPLPLGDQTEGAPSVGRRFRSFLNLDVQQVEAFVKDNHLTENALFLTAFGYALSKYTDRNEVLFTTIYNGRSDLKTQDMVGMLVKTLPVVAAFGEKTGVREAVSEMKTQLMRSMANDLCSFAELAREYELTSDLMFIYQGDIVQDQLVGGKRATEVTLDTDRVIGLLNIEIRLVEGRYQYFAEYDGGRYSQDLISLLGETLEKILQGMLTAASFQEVDLLGEKAASMLRKMNDTAAEVLYRPAYRLLQDSAEKDPERPACVASGVTLTYGALNEKANRTGAALVSLGVGRNQMVSLLLDRTHWVYVAREGILKAGGAFISLDTEYPDERIRFILEDSGSRILLTTRDVYEARRDFLEGQTGLHVLFVEEISETGPKENLNVSVEEEDLAYCIYTSGSTGTPKGVMITQRNLLNFAQVNEKNKEALYYARGNHVSLAMASISFDVSIMEEFISLSEGMCICMANEEEIHNPRLFAKLLTDNKVDVMNATPSFLSSIIDIPECKEALKGICTYDLGAEAYLTALTEKIHALNPDALIINGYGPTEATISCTCTVIKEGDRITIGGPNANVGAYVLDKELRLLPPGAIGELAITGDGVGKGYLGLEEKTRKAFISLATPCGEERAYRTGDAAAILPDGNIFFLGRLDNQVKLRGLRIELDEIQTVLLSYPGIKNGIVLVRGEGASAYLCAWFCAAEPVDREELKAYLGTRLARYMIPSAYLQMDELPMTQNGKIDKKQLPEIKNEGPALKLLPPANQTEELFCTAMAEALGVEAFGATDNFFEMGGTSLTATKVLMKAINAGYELSYSDIFSKPTPRELARLIGGEEEKEDLQDLEVTDFDYGPIHALLQGNTLENYKKGEKRPLGNVCITGAAGFLGIHLLKEFIDYHEGTAYCILRGNKTMTAEERLRNMLVYYFDTTLEEAFCAGRIIVLDGDVTDPAFYDSLMQYPVDTYLNCAANVKHFSSGTEIEDINVGGVKQGLSFAQRKGCRFIQISTVSVAGLSINDVPAADTVMDERMLYFGQDLSNKYIHSKFLAERLVLEHVLRGADAKIMRVGNLMARETDGEFQVNFSTNNFLGSLKAYHIIGKIPYEDLELQSEFSAVDCVARAVLLLSTAPKECVVFHPYNNHAPYMGDVICAMRECRLEVAPCEREEYDLAYRRAAQEEGKAAYLNTLIAYDEPGKHIVQLDSQNGYTSQALMRVGFFWPLTDPDYMKNFIEKMEDLLYFEE